MKSIRDFVNITPMIKGRPRFGKGFAYTPTRTRNYEKELKEHLKLMMDQQGQTPLEGPISVEVHFRMLKPKKPANPYPSGDIDNYVKAFLDAANEVLFLDDKQIVRLSATKEYALDPSLQGIIFHTSEKP